MAFEMELIRDSQEIFYHLLKYHELSRDTEERLYQRYVESEELQALVKSQGELADSRVERYGNVIYLIPEMENSYLGFTKTALKTALCRSNATDSDYYLSQFAILVLLLEFYDGRGANAKTRDFMKVGELQNSLSERLQEGVDALSEEEQAQAGIAFSDMQAAYEALKSDVEHKRQKTTKEGFLHHILVFLQKQGLIEYIERDETILPTPKLDHFMEYNLLNERNYDRVRRMFAERGN
ncbi:MAG: hypothetical protein IJT34_07095 [Butyrivibrio sp.]|nr:hypothetical protein [Butyrivibrio sp.]